MNYERHPHHPRGPNDGASDGREKRQTRTNNPSPNDDDNAGCTTPKRKSADTYITGRRERRLNHTFRRMFQIVELSDQAVATDREDRMINVKPRTRWQTTTT